ncbi:hypothetical protein [endosymbiont of Lamellibrachia barhami]|uniref:hypothetical protein n=1 Tax=endosymbiont of Lamellibrachia barhami TaxID=205975 RepID=UPI0015ABC6B1|nr:hypothetical protein [endosymbiont of Lamellibrachia barhami]
MFLFGNYSVRIISAVVILFLLCGCATVKFTDYQQDTISNLNNQQFKDGLSISILAITDKNKVISYFGTDLLSSGILPVLIVAENKNESSSFIIHKERITLSNIVENDIEAIDQVREYSAGEEVATVGAAAGIMPIVLPLFFVGAAMVNDANEIMHNMLEKEIRTEMLSPSEKISGFVYFSIPKEKNEQKQQYIIIDVIKYQLTESERFIFPIKWRNNQ